MFDADVGKIRIGRNGDGGYVIPNDIKNIAGVVSIGIGREVSFDLHFARMGVKVFQYDHTVHAPPVIHENFVFNKMGWANRESKQFITLGNILENNCLEGEDLILKFDVENSEWDALVDLDPDLLRRFRIIACELHGFGKLEDPNFFKKVSRALDILTTHHTVVHMHPNNCGGIAFVAGILLPRLLEFSFLRKDRANFAPSYSSIPSDLDCPNIRKNPEIILTPFHMNPARSR